MQLRSAVINLSKDRSGDGGGGCRSVDGLKEHSYIRRERLVSLVCLLILIRLRTMGQVGRACGGEAINNPARERQSVRLRVRIKNDVPPPPSADLSRGISFKFNPKSKRFASFLLFPYPMMMARDDLIIMMIDESSSAAARKPAKVHPQGSVRSSRPRLIKASFLSVVREGKRRRGGTLSLCLIKI